jgi:hypothetical protein
VGLAEIVTVGGGITVTVALAVAVLPTGSVDVIVYLVVCVGEIIIAPI